ncbi:MAG: hypothetical protein J6S63_01340 [Atopobiaceae bacterium]|nr:hypothetical protein [Atopobiaceae bacterium]
MGGKGSGGYRDDMSKARAKSPVVMAQNPEVPNADTNRRIIAFIRELKALPKITIEDIDAVRERTDKYMELCAKHGIKFQVNGYCVALGISRDDLSSIFRGVKTCKGMTVYPEVVEELHWWYSIMAAYAEASLNEKNTNPAGDIFLLKNHFGYRDTREETVVRVDATPQLASGEDAARKYAELVGVEIVSVEDAQKKLPEKS